MHLSDLCISISKSHHYTNLVHMFLMQITVTPLGAFTNAEIDCSTYLKEWLPNVADRTSSSAL